MTKFSKYFNYKIFAFLLLVFTMSCDNYLSENPDNRVELDTPEKAAQLLTNAYTNAAYTFTEWMSDNVTFTSGTYLLPEHNQLYRWEDPTSTNQDTPANFWTATYDAIAHANEVLAVIDDLPGDRKYKQAIKGEAYLVRAYGHFMLVNLFARQYDDNTADTDPGIPYVMEPETVFIKQYERLSVDDVYDRIENDLEEGLDLVDDSFYANSGKYHFTRNAALAFASRFYLYKNEFDKCIEYSSELLGSTPEVFIKDIEALQEESVENFAQLFTQPNDASNLLLIRNVTNFPVNAGHWPSPGLIQNLYFFNPFETDDIRFPIDINQDGEAWSRVPVYLRGSGYGIAKYEFLFERSSLTSNVGLYYTIQPVFRGEEVLLNRAESYIRTTKMSQAYADLQIFINKRYLNNPTISASVLSSYYGSTNQGMNALRYVTEERRKEFMHEGLRWFDIKRFRLQVTHTEFSGNSNVLTADDPRKVLQIPQNAIDVGGLEANPR
jgi:starch-binding outer membrane protein, SusD/RagB family